MIVVVGAGGQLGTAFGELLGAAAVPLTRAELDLDRLDEIAPVISGCRPTLVVNCAAYNAVDRAEGEQEQARRINALAVERLAAAARDADAGFLTFSTDFVFPGDAIAPYTESSAPGPLNVYGHTKLEGEQLALAAHPGALVVRTSWVMSGTPPNFAATALRLAMQGGARVVDDQTGRPTLAADLAPAALHAAKRGANGVLHLTNQGETTRYALAREIADLARLDPKAISPCTSVEFGAAAPRPAYSVLGSERLTEIGIEPLPHYRRGLEQAVARLASTAT